MQAVGGGQVVYLWGDYIKGSVHRRCNLSSASSFVFPDMKIITFIAILMPLASATKCSAPSNDICASFVYSNGTASQDIHTNDAGCTEVVDPKAISGIRVYDCWCGLWRFVKSFPSVELKAHHDSRR